MVPFICNFRGENNKAPRFYLGALNLFILRREQQSSKVLPRSFESCGENRIRTCEPVLPVTRFPGVPLQPLEHLSFCNADAKVRISEQITKFI